MDPWLEKSWGGIHARLITDLQRQIAPQLPDQLYAEIEETVYVLDREDEERSQQQRFRPDVAIFHQPDFRPDASAVAVMEPEKDFIQIEFPLEPIVETFIEIRQLSEGNPLVTAIEVLSPTNKSTSVGREDYLKKRQAYVAAHVNIVEIDLLRSGDPLLETNLDALIREHPRLASEYRCSIRKPHPWKSGVYILPISLRQRLPRIKIPLRKGDPAVIIDLQEPIDQAYQLGSYGKRIDYSKPPVPPLPPAEAEWAAALVQAPAVAG